MSRQEMPMGTTTAWMTTDAAHMMRPLALAAPGHAPIDDELTFDHGVRHQRIAGFGASFTDSSAFLVNGLDGGEKRTVMQRLFSSDKGIGLSLLRNPIGASDYARWVYSYDDMAGGVSDEHLDHFSIEHDRADILPLTAWAMRINPDLRLIASPWSAPGWMKDSGTMISGSLLKRWYGVYADYLVAFIKAYADEGVDVHAITIQNEPLFEPSHYPGMPLSAREAVDFVLRHLRPALHAAGLRTRIFGYDHNWDHPEYPEYLLAHAAEVFDGIAWHWYGGEPSVQSLLSRRFGDKPVYFTEGSGGDWIPAFEAAFSNVMRSGIDILRHRSRSFMLWNIALDERNGPVVPGFGRSTCRGLLRIGKGKRVEYTLDYYGLGHFSSVIRPGATRIESSQTPSIRTLACDNPDGSTGYVFFNDAQRSRYVHAGDGALDVAVSMPPKSALSIIARGGDSGEVGA
jgi:glucosylceramidase